MNTNLSKMLRYVFIVELVVGGIFIHMLLSFHTVANIQALISDTKLMMVLLLFLINSLLCIMSAIITLRKNDSIILSLFTLAISTLALFSPILIYMIKRSAPYQENQQVAVQIDAGKTLASIDINELKNIYTNINKSFSVPVTVAGYTLKYVSQSDQVAIITYKEAPYATYINGNSSNTFTSDTGASMLKSLIDKKVSVLVPPFRMFGITYTAKEKYADNKPLFYAKIESEGYDMELSLVQHVLTTATSISDKAFSIDPRSNLDNLQYLQYYTDFTGSELNNYAQARYTQLCPYAATSHAVLSVGQVPAENASIIPGALYAVLEGQPHAHFLFTSIDDILQLDGGETFTKAQSNEIISWLTTFLKNKKMQVDICNGQPKMTNNFREDLSIHSAHAQTIFGTSDFPTFDTINANVKITDNTGQEQPPLEFIYKDLHPKK